MATGKRAAGRELNHDNWNEEEETEEVGDFKKASEDELQKRVRKVARRRIAGDSENNAPANPFSGFGGFKTNSGLVASTPAAATNSSPFSFLAKIPSATAPKLQTNGTSETSQKSSEQTEYLSKMKALNVAVAEWIKTHVDENPFCILTPIFKDYEKYLKEFEELKKKPQASVETAKPATTTQNEPKAKEPEPATTAPAPTFSFGKPSAPVTSSSTSNSSSSNSIFNSFKFGSEPVKTTVTSPPKTSAEPPKTTFSFGSPGALSSQPSATSTFSFGLSSTTTPSSLFGASSGFSGFGSVSQAPAAATEEEAEEEPPKNEFVPVVEDDSLFSKRCKVFVKGASDFSDRGVGTLYIKKVEDKVQMLVRADTNLGNILLNIMLVEGLPASRMGKNNVMVVCVPTPDAKPPPTSVLLRVKTGEEADELLEQINKYKK